MILNNQNETQQEFLERLKQRLPEHIGVATALMESLQLNKDSAYRRMNGKSQLSYNEAMLLAKKYKVESFNAHEIESEHIFFQRKDAIKTHQDITRNLTELSGLFKHHNAIPNSRIIYSTKDIPPFYQFAYPDLAAFKLYCWMNSVDNNQEKDRSFRPQEITDQFGVLCKDLTNGFAKVSSTEIWSETTVLNFIRQVEYYYDSKLIKDKNVILDVCEQYRALFKFLEKQATLGCKLHPNFPFTKTAIPYNLYFNEILIMENSILAYQGEQRMFFQCFAYFNFHATTDKQHCKTMEDWLLSQIEKSVHLSSTREKERNQFFSKINIEIGGLMDRIVGNR